MMDYNVDMGMWAHKHNYERLWPIYNFTIYKQDPLPEGQTDPILSNPYIDPKAPFHITTGTAVMILSISYQILNVHLNQNITLNITLL